MRKVLLLTTLLAIITVTSYSQTDKFWSVNTENVDNIVTDKAVARLTYPKAFKLFNLNTAILRQDLLSIVDNRSANQTMIVSIPNAMGELEQFELVEASNFEPALQARFPEIRAYSGKGITDKYATIKLSLSPQGIQTMVFRTDRANEFIEPYSKDHTIYSVYSAHRDKGALPWTCTTEDQQMFSGLNEQIPVTEATGSSSGTLKTMRLAQSCNAEYSNYFGASNSGQVALVLAAFNATLTRCNGVYEKDLALHLNLIANTTDVIYYNASTDPYSNTLSQWNLQLQQTLTSVIGNNNYDIGHMFGASGGGGNAGCIGCVCVNPATSNTKAKGSGITSPADGVPMGDNFDIDYVAHEVGHQLGGNHTFSMSLEGTGQNKEVGSGITIMGYAGITAQDVARHSIDIFHETTIAQIQANLATKSCPVTVNMTANHAPVVAGVSNYTIPISTPFALTASATDAENDPLTYCWEQNDNSTTSGTNSVASPTKTTGPNWLSFPATIVGTRTFPQLSTILSGLNVTPPLPGGDAGANIEALSSVSRTLNFRLTVRDNRPYNPGSTIGQTAFTDAVVTVTNTSGPFVVTAPNTAVTWNAGSSQTVTWNVNNTTASPVSCANVKISLSTDGGNTFPTVLIASTPNDGSQVITVPAGASATCRIKVEAVGNIFFDISNANFTISGAAPCGDPTGLNASPITTSGATVNWNAVANAISYAVDYKLSSALTWITAGTTSSTSTIITGLSEGTVYDWRVKATCSGGSGNFVVSQFTTTVTPTCLAPSGLTTSNITSNSATASWTAVNGAASYDVSYNDGSNSNWIPVATGTTATSVSITGLSSSTPYEWRILSNCTAVGLTSPYASVQFTTTAPGSCNAPTGLTASNLTSSSATLSWTAVSGAASYEVGYKKGNGNSYTTVTTSSTTQDIFALDPTSLYDWRVRANCTAVGLTSDFTNDQFTTTEPTACPGIYDIGNNDTRAVAPLVPFNTNIFGKIEVSNDQDYYKFVITNPGTITMTLLNLPTNYNLRLYNNSGSILATSANGGPNDEIINATLAVGGTYFALVYPSKNKDWDANNCYKLRVQLGTASRFENGDYVELGSTKVVVFPNPVNFNANLVFNATKNGIADITVTNQLGAVVLRQSVSVNQGDNIRKLDVSNLVNGMYYIRIKTGDKTSMAKIIIAK